MSRKSVLWFQLTCCIFVFGCTKTSRPSLESEPQGGFTAASDGTTPDEFEPDLSVPRLDPNPVVWVEDSREVEEVPPAREEAQALMSRADRLKSAEEFAEAEKAYREAMEADPTWAYPAYQLACNYELWNQHDRALTQYMVAVELGFDDFPTALSDNELGRIRDRPDFQSTLAVIRQRYLDSSATRVGQPLAIRPRSTKPSAGWPVILLLHGFGDTNLSYLDFAVDWAELGFVAVAVPGSVPSRGGRYQWAMESTEPTHQDLQAIIKSPLFDDLVNRDRVFLLGFSQGALHAMLLTAEQPDLYAGVVALSPGGSLSTRLVPPSLNRNQRPARCVLIHGTQEPHGPLVPIWSQACQSAGWKFDSKTHPGGHHFPDDWDQMQPKIAKFLTD